jgi:hypothetical protein
MKKYQFTTAAVWRNGGSVLKWSFVLRNEFSNGRQFSVSRFASGPNVKSFHVILERQKTIIQLKYFVN